MTTHKARQSRKMPTPFFLPAAAREHNYLPNRFDETEASDYSGVGGRVQLRVTKADSTSFRYKKTIEEPIGAKIATATWVKRRPLLQAFSPSSCRFSFPTISLVTECHNWQRT